MEDINRRFKEVRKACGKNQTEWAKYIGITRSGISGIETGERAVTLKHLRMLEIYPERPINVEWVKTGEGQMFREVSRNQAIAAYMNSVMEEDDSSFRKRFIDALTKLDTEDWELIARMVKKIADQEANGKK